MNAQDRTSRTAVHGRYPATRRRSFAGILILVVAVLISSFVTADVILTYQVNSSVGPNATSDFGFHNGDNYYAAHGLGLVTSTLPTPPNSISAEIMGIQSVGVELLNVTVFNVTATTGAATTIASAPEVAGAAITVANLVCAYAFISDAPPTGASTTAASGAIGHCSAVVPTLGAFAAVTACTGAGSATGVETVNLTAAAGVTGTPGTCKIPSGTTANHIAEYISYAIVTENTIVLTTLNTVGIVVTAP